MGAARSGGQHVPGPVPLPAAHIGLERRTVASGSCNELNLRTLQKSLKSNTDTETSEPKPPKKKINLLLVVSDSDDKNEHALVHTALDCYRAESVMSTDHVFWNGG
ncbi:hypothetical protein UY3_08448 [Chelonia mydas]|uniref:Uncharacterized protein n=1 Tax=Chelonia mydas TaxID=8469 RepID=M7B8Z1_CHEMY|nr:hypothetical protein UY3_08448 [Chelonia mydas]